MAAITYWCAAQHLPALQQQIFSNAQAAVTSANAGDIDLSVDGRTATLTGTVTNDVQKQQLLNVVRDADGIRTVNDQLSIVKTAGADEIIVAAEDLSAETIDDDNAAEQNAAAEILAENDLQPIADTTSSSVNASEISENVENTQIQSADASEVSENVENTQIQSAEASEVSENVENTQIQSVDANEVSKNVENTQIQSAATDKDATDKEASEKPTVLNENEADEKAMVAEAPVDAPTITNAPDAVQPIEAGTQVAELVIPQAPSAQKSADQLSQRARALLEQARIETASSLIDPQTPRPENDDAQTQTSSSLSDAQRSVAITETPSLKMQVEQGTLTLTGDISDQDNLLTFIRSAMSTFGANYVVNSVQVHDNTARADWLPALNKFLPDMSNISNAGIDIIESQITLSGEAKNITQHDNIIDKALSGLGDLSLVERISIASESSTQNGSTTEATSVDSSTTNALPEPAKAQTQPLEAAFESLDTDKILFQSGSDLLVEESLGVIETIAALFAEYPSINIEIDGHTDASGISANNLKLSQLRANAVRDSLIQQGIAAERLSAYGFGDGVPIADNSTPAGRRLNRRIEFNF